MVSGNQGGPMTKETEIQVIREGAAAISELLAQGALGDEAWESTAEFLLRCRKTSAKLRAGDPR
jgi:hypothetical protein